MSPFEKLQTDVEGFLLSCESLNPCTITHIRPRTAEEATGIQTKLDQALKGLIPRNGKQGISIIIGMPGLEGVQANVRALSGEMVLTLVVTEFILVNMGLNGTRMSAEEVALEVAALLQQQSFQPWGPMVAEPRLITPETAAVKEGQVVYNVNMKVQYVGAKKAKVATPSLTQAGNELTLICATELSQIYYTLDGSFPGPSNMTGAQLYLSPIALPVGTHQVRFSAWAPCMVGSHVMQKEVVVAEV